MSVTVKDPTALRGDPDRTSIGGIVQLLRGLYTYTDGATKIVLASGLEVDVDELKLLVAAPATPLKDVLYSNLLCRGWVNFKDVAGTITINAAVNCTVGFRTGTAAGDYALAMTTAGGDAFGAIAGMAVLSGSSSLTVAQNASVFSHTASMLNFVTFNLAGGLTRPSECTIVVFGN